MPTVENEVPSLVCFDQPGAQSNTNINVVYKKKFFIKEKQISYILSYESELQYQ